MQESGVGNAHGAVLAHRNAETGRRRMDFHGEVGAADVRPGYKADVVLVRRGEPWTLTNEMVKSKCGWTPLEGERFNWRVVHTFCNGRHILDHDCFDDSVQGEEVRFRDKK